MKKHTIARLLLGLLPAALAFAAASGASPTAESASVANARRPVPPVAAVRPHAVESPFGSRQDEYYWLRDDTRTNPEMLALPQGRERLPRRR